METRILIPKQLKIVVKGLSPTSLRDSHGKISHHVKDFSKTKKRKLNFTGKHNLSNSESSTQYCDVQKPTSSSGCDAESDTDSNLNSNDDSDVTEEEEFRQSVSEEEDDSNKNISGDDSNQEGDCKNQWTNNRYNYNLRRNTTNSNESVQLRNSSKNCGTELGLKDHCDGNVKETPLVTIANADSINQIESRQEKAEIKICAARKIEKGTIFTPNEGQVSIVFLKNFPSIRADDIRFVFGCFDRTVDDDEAKEEVETESENENSSDIEKDDDDKDKIKNEKRRKRKNQIRLCNWVRFVKQVPTNTDPHDPKVNANVRAKFVERKAVLEFTQSVPSGTELLVYFDIDSLTQNVKEEIHGNIRQHKGINPNQIAPLDLSKSLDVDSKPKLRSSKSLSISLEKLSKDVNRDQSDNDNDLKQSRSPTPPRPSQQFFPFSINSVLQPVKLFQPYNHRSDLSNSNNRQVNTNSVQYPTITLQHNPQTVAVASIQSSLNGASAGRNSGIHMMTHLRNAGNGGNPVGTLKPILRTRGRERSLLPCEVCGKAFDRPSLLKRHMRTHTGEKPHICDVCSKGFSTSSSLNTHRRIHSGEKPHQCPVCGKRFTASSNLYYHRMTHNKEKPHKCLCGKSFPTPGDLKSHQYVHSGSWPYNCPVCHRGFSKQTNLRNHLLLHSGDKPHNCQACGKKFALACNLRAHLRTHEEEPVSSCLSCKRTFLSSLNMLDNGQCRSCIIHQQQHQQQQQQNSPSISINSSSSSNSSLSRNIFSSLSIPSSVQSTGNSGTTTNNVNLNGNGNGNGGSELKSPENLSLSALTKIAGNSTGNVFPNSAAAAAAALSMSLSESDSLLSSAMTNPASNFHFPSPYHLSESILGPRPNPFLEQLFQWNWRFAKETAGNLGLMQQKLIESQMLAAQLMSVSSNGSSDVLKFRL